MDNVSPVNSLLTIFALFQFIVTLRVGDTFVINLHKELLEIKEIVTLSVVLVVYELFRQGLL
jgi:hypothetical protein